MLSASTPLAGLPPPRLVGVVGEVVRECESFPTSHGAARRLVASEATDAVVNCPYCSSPYKQQFKGKLCQALSAPAPSALRVLVVVLGFLAGG